MREWARAELIEQSVEESSNEFTTTMKAFEKQVNSATHVHEKLKTLLEAGRPKNSLESLTLARREQLNKLQQARAELEQKLHSDKGRLAKLELTQAEELKKLQSEIDAIKAGNFSVENLIKKFDLTEEQKKEVKKL